MSRKQTVESEHGINGIGQETKWSPHETSKERAGNPEYNLRPGGGDGKHNRV